MRKIFSVLSLLLFVTISQAQVSFTTDVTSGCTPLTVTFTNTSSGGANYYWYFNDGSPAETTQNATHTFTQSGVFYVTLDVYDASWNYLGNAFEEITVGGAPNFWMQNDTVCPNNLLSLGTYEQQDSYSWDFGDGSSLSTDSYPAHAYNSPGTYVITLTAVNSCGTYTVDTSIVVGTNLQVPPYIYFGANRDTVCPNEVVGYSADYGYSSYEWHFGDASTETTSDNYVEHSFSNFGVKPAAVIITNGCGNSRLFKDTVIVSPNVQITSAPWYYIDADTTCPNSQVTFNVDNSLASADWDFGDGNSFSGYDATHSYASFGTYYVSCTVTNNCGNSYVIQDSVIIDPSSPVINPGGGAPNEVCPGEQFYTYAYANNGVSYTVDFGDGSPVESNQIGWQIEHIYPTPGTYTLTYVITNDCGNQTTFTQSITCTSSSQIVNPYFQIDNNPACPGDFVNFNTNWEYSYYFDFGDGTGSATEWQHKYSSEGTYPVSVIIQNFCGNSVTLYDTVVVQNNLPFSGYPYLDHYPQVACPNSEVHFYTDNGYATYSWNFGDGITSTNRNAEHIYQAYGNYPVSVTITNGCGSDTTLYSTIAIQNNVPLDNVGLNMPNDSICPGDQLFFEADGQDGYDYLWDFGDGNTSESMSTSNSYDNIGWYDVSLTITNGCGIDSIFYDSVYVGNNVVPNSTSYQAFAQQEGCLGDELYFVLVPAGAGNISWDFGDGTSTSETFIVKPNDMSAVDVSFHAYSDTGSYYANYEITNGCGNTYSDSLLVQVGTVGSNVDLDATFWWDDTQTACQGQPVEFMAVGGATYSWKFGDGSGALITYSSLSPVYHTYEESGTYTITLTTYNQCGNSDSRQEEIFIPDSKVNISTNTVVDATCGENNGVAVVSASGGLAPYTYSWSNGDNSVIADSLGSGMYIVTVTDNNDCATEGMATVSDNEGPTILLDNIVNNSCFGDEKGSISVTVLGGVPPYSILWSNGDQTEDIFNLEAGPYEIFVQDANGCMGMASFTVTSPSEPILSVVTNPANCGTADGTAMATINNGEAPYNFIWPNTTGPNGNTSGLLAGVYELLVIDANTCLIQTDFVVNEKTAPIIVEDSIVTGTCSGDLSSIYISTIGGTGPFTYLWSNGDSNDDLLDVLPGEYQLQVTGQNGCSSYLTETLEMTLPEEVSICIVTVDTNTNTNEIIWSPSATAGLDYYNIYKESSQSGLYYLIGTSDADSLSYYSDIYSDPTIRSWRYKVSAVDNCGNESELSDNHKTLHLTANLGVGNVVNLIWDDYEGFSYSTFYINRYHPTTGWVLIDSIASNLHSYTDQTPPSDSNLVYTIELNAPGVCSPQKAQDHNSTRSNRASINAGDLDIPTPDAIDEVESLEISIMPNPTTGIVTLSMGRNSLNKSIVIRDVQGKILDRYSLGDNQTKVTFDISNYEKAIYFVQVYSEKGIETLKLVKQ